MAEWSSKESRGTSLLLVVFTAAWLVVTLWYVPWAWVMTPRLVRMSSPDYWTVLSPYLSVALPPAAALLLWRGRDSLAALLLVSVAASWVLWEVYYQQFLIFVNPLEDVIAIELLSLLTLVALGPYCAFTGLRTEASQERGPGAPSNEGMHQSRRGS